MSRIIYIAWFVDNPTELLKQCPILLKGSRIQPLAHHMTVEFRPPSGLDNIVVGQKETLYGYGQVVGKSIQAILVRSDRTDDISRKNFPHITLAIADGASPKLADELIQKAYDNKMIEYFETPIAIPATQGYFDGHSNIIN